MAFNQYSLDLEASSSQYASIASASFDGLALNSDFTFETWVKLESQPTSGNAFELLARWESGSYVIHWLYYNNGGTHQLLCQYRNTSNQTTSGYYNITLTTAKWTHLAVIADISVPSMKFYVNGTEYSATMDSTLATTIRTDTSGQLDIGRRSDAGGTFYFDGLISNFRVFSDIRTGTEIQDNMYSILTGTSNNLVGSWFNDANDYNDDAGTNNLTSSGSPVFSTNVPFTGANTTDWSAPYEIQSDNTKVSGSSDHTDIPLLIADGNLSSGVYAGLQSDGRDLRITTDLAGTTEIPFEIVSINTATEKAEIWAKVPTLSYNSNTSLYIWYGNASAVAYDANAPFGAYSVWTNYDRVHHFDTLVTDYSGNGKTLTNNGGVAQDTSSKINDGTDYGTSNSSKYFTYNTMPATGSTSAVVQFWVKSSQTTTGDCYHVGWDNGSAHALIFQLNGVSGGDLRVYWSGGLYSLYATTTMNDGAWHQVTYTYAGGTSGAMALYIDGDLEDSTTGTGNLDNQATGTAEFIGRRSASAVNYLSAKTDELRTIYGGTNPSADWIATEYNNQNAPSTFWVSVTATAGTLLAQMI